MKTFIFKNITVKKSCQWWYMNCIICIIIFVLHLYMTMESCYIDGQNPLLLMKCQTRINSNKHEHTDTMSCIMYIHMYVYMYCMQGLTCSQKLYTLGENKVLYWKINLCITLGLFLCKLIELRQFIWYFIFYLVFF